MEIKTASEIYAKVYSEALNSEKDSLKVIYKAMKEYAEQFIDYASENVEVDYNKLTPVYYKGNIVDDGVEVFIPKGEFEKIKELIK